MSILISFIPWFVYWILLSFSFLSSHMLPAAVFAGLLCALVINTRSIMQRKVKVLQFGTLLFFLIISAVTIFAEPEWLGRWVSLMGSGALALIALVSILIGKPFTMQYARERVPSKHWDSPQFRHTSFVITWAWFAAFVVMMIPPAATLFGVDMQLWVHWAISICCFLVAIKFTYWYRERHKIVEGDEAQ